MTEPIRLTKSQQRRFYRQAVELTLIKLYNQPETKSKAIVSAWWKRISDTEAFKSNLIFHVEPLHAAADIAHLRSLAITADNEQLYRNLLASSRDRVLHTHSRKNVATSTLPKNLHVEKPQTQFRANAKKVPAEQKLLARG